MKEFNGFPRIYYIAIWIIIALMVVGLLFVPPREDILWTGYLLHFLLVVILSVGLLLYPKYETHGFRIFLIVFVSSYYYMLFFLYPESWSTFILICLIPAISIFFFDTKLFYFTIVLNVFLVTATLAYVKFVDRGEFYPYILQDLVGNVINYIASQIILFLIFYLSHIRMEKQQLYFEKVQQAERLKTSGQLAAAVAHEIRNPLTVVKGFLEFYKSDPSLKKEMERHFTLMIDELNTAEHVISHFLSISKPNTDSATEIIDVKHSLKSVTDLLRSYGLLRNNDIDLEIDEDCFINVNKIEFKQLMINLMKNAIEASPDNKPIFVKAEKLNSSVQLKVTDSGCGISEEEIKLLGSPFYSLKSKGTGLGLMICFNIVEKSNGTISFESIKGQGTTVSIRFPLLKKP
ncbi:MAG: ATP-binding protein [Anaerobacillus sp.]|uniref:ATP-binding protein n=1 Tax=Anaerobacillus sp. TaxID=1872506 RepID=UPI003919EE06